MLGALLGIGGTAKKKRSNVLPPWTYILTAMWYPGFLL